MQADRTRGSALEIAVYLRFGTDIGFGHASRCAALAHALHTLGARCCLFGPSEAPLPNWLAAAFDQSRVRACDHGSASAGMDRFDWLVLDDHAPDVECVSTLAAAADRTLRIVDDPGAAFDDPVAADLVASPTPLAQSSGMAPPAHLLAGSDYAMLRQSFAEMRFAKLRRGDATGGGDRYDDRCNGRRSVVLAPGSADAAGLSAQLVPAILDAGCSADVIASAQAPAIHQLRQMSAQYGDRVRLHADLGAADIATLLARAVFWLGAASTACWERCTLGVPGIAFVTADNQRALGARLRELGLSVAELGAGGEVAPDTIAMLRERLMQVAPDAAPDASVLGLCDGLGAYRLASTLAAPHDRKGRRITLQPATWGDADLLYAWQRHPRTRRFARTSTAPERGEHMEWLDRRLRDPRCLLNLIHAGGNPVGCLRLDLQDAGPAVKRDVLAFEVSIYTAPEEYGRGIGKGALRQAAALTPFAWRVAEVLEDNEASRALFAAAGYEGPVSGMLHAPLVGTGPG